MTISDKYISKYRHFLWLILFIPLYMFFIYCEKTISPEYIMFSSLDLKIPFIKEFVIPYLFWYIYMAVAFIYLGVTSKEDYFRLYFMMFSGMAVAYIIFFLFPNGQNLRPAIIETDFLSRIVKYIYATDTSTNVSPSIHVLNSIVVHIALVNCERLKSSRLIKEVSFLIMVSICASTVLIKQHSIIDVVWGTVLATVLYVIVYEVPGLAASEAAQIQRPVKYHKNLKEILK